VGLVVAGEPLCREAVVPTSVLDGDQRRQLHRFDQGNAPDLAERGFRDKQAWPRLKPPLLAGEVQRSLLDRPIHQKRNPRFGARETALWFDSHQSRRVPHATDR
jgi:hypothetical protein